MRTLMTLSLALWLVACKDMPGADGRYDGPLDPQRAL